MVSSKAMTVVRQVYDWVESTLWAALLAFRAESMRAPKIAAENRSYCEKWGMRSGTREHTLCTIDLQALRKSIQLELSDDGAF